MIHYSFACTILLNNYGSIDCTGEIRIPCHITSCIPLDYYRRVYWSKQDDDYCS